MSRVLTSLTTLTMVLALGSAAPAASTLERQAQLDSLAIALAAIDDASPLSLTDLPFQLAAPDEREVLSLETRQTTHRRPAGDPTDLTSTKEVTGTEIRLVLYTMEQTLSSAWRPRNHWKRPEEQPATIQGLPVTSPPSPLDTLPPSIGLATAIVTAFTHLPNGTVAAGSLEDALGITLAPAAKAELEHDFTDVRLLTDAEGRIALKVLFRGHPYYLVGDYREKTIMPGIWNSASGLQSGPSRRSMTRSVSIATPGMALYEPAQFDLEAPGVWIEVANGWDQL